MSRFLVFIFLLLSVSAAAGDSIPEFDTTGKSYHQPFDQLLPSFTGNKLMRNALPATDSLLLKAHVKKISSDGEVYSFNKSGQLVSYTSENHYKRRKYGKYSEEFEVTYDEAGRMTAFRYTHQYTAVSRGEYHFVEEARKTYRWNDEKHSCRIKGKGGESANVAYVGDDEDEWEEEGEYFFDEHWNLHSYEGWSYGYKAKETYSFDAFHRLVKRTDLFDEIKSGIEDSIAYVAAANGTTSCLHYFTVILPLRPKHFLLIERLDYDRFGHLVFHQFTGETPLLLPNYGFHDSNRYIAKWDSLHLLQEDYIDVNDDNYYRYYYSYTPAGDGYFQICTNVLLDTIVNDLDPDRAQGYRNGDQYVWLSYDSARKGIVIPPDTLDRITTRYNRFGLPEVIAHVDFLDYYYGKVPIYFAGELRKYSDEYEYEYYK